MNLPIHRLVRGAAIAVLMGGCTMTRLHVSNDTRLDLRIAESEFHRITYVRVYEDDGELVLHGKVYHDGHCVPEEHVDLAIKDGQGRAILTDNLLLMRRGGHRQYGWYGASFRTKIRALPTDAARIMLAVHETSCTTVEGIFDPGKKSTLPPAPSTTPVGPAAVSRGEAAL